MKLPRILFETGESQNILVSFVADIVVLQKVKGEKRSAFAEEL